MSSTRDWDATTYDRISAPQQLWAAEQLDGLAAARRRGRARRRLRLGQGDAGAGRAGPERTRVRGRRGARRWSSTRVRRSATAPRVFCQDLVELELPEPVDLVFSNATFHWIPDHDALFAALHRNMKPGARLLAQCGGKGNIDRFRKLADEVARSSDRWARYFDGWTGPWNYATAGGDRDAAAAGRVHRCEHVARRTARPSSTTHARSSRTVCLVRHLDRIPAELRDAFVDDVLARYGEPVVLDYVRLNMTARRR